MNLRRPLAGAALLALALALALAPAGPASGHVSVQPKSVPAASEAVTLTVRVPNERRIATTAVQLLLPAGTTFSKVEPRLVPGWQVGVSPEAVTWSGGTIAPDAAQDFGVTVGPLPATEGTLLFRVLQTYANGEVVRWIEPPRPGGGEPEHPAAVLRLTAPVPTTAPATTSTAAPVPVETTAAPVPVETTAAPVPVETTAAATNGDDGDDGDDEGGGGSAAGPLLGGAIVVVLVGAGLVLERRRRRR